MSLEYGDKPCILVRGDYHPAEMYVGENKVTGWNTETKVGDSLAFEKTYNDTFDILAKGKGKQESFWGYEDAVAEQKKLDGVNLLNATSLYGTTKTINGGTITCNADGSFTCSGTPTDYIAINLPRTELGNLPRQMVLSLSGDYSNFACVMYFNDVDNSILGNIGVTSINCVKHIDIDVLFPTATAYYVEFKRDQSNVEMTGTAYVMLTTEANKDHAYEPYCGGIPSPNPNYPQPITTNLPAQTYKVPCTDSRGGWWEFALDADMYSIGDVHDRVEIDKYYGLGYVKREFGNTVYDGSDDESWAIQTVVSGINFYSNVVTQYVKNGSYKIFSNQYVYSTLSSQIRNNIFVSHTGRLNITSDFYDKLTDFVSALSDSNLIVVGRLATPTTTPITATWTAESTATELSLTMYGEDKPLSPDYPRPLIASQGELGSEGRNLCPINNFTENNGSYGIDFPALADVYNSLPIGTVFTINYDYSSDGDPIPPAGKAYISFADGILSGTKNIFTKENRQAKTALLYNSRTSLGATYQTFKNIQIVRDSYTPETIPPYQPYRPPTSAIIPTLRAIPDGNGGWACRDTWEPCVKVNGVWRSRLTRNVGTIDSYTSETVPQGYVSTTGQLSAGATIWYRLASPEVTLGDLVLLSTYPTYTSFSTSGSYLPDVRAAARHSQKSSSFYGVMFDSGANSGNYEVSRLGDATGLVAGVGTDTACPRNDFDSIYPWSARRRCCGTFDAQGNFVVAAYKGEPGYVEDGSNGEVWVEHSLFYYKHTYEGDAETILISGEALEGYLPAPIFVNSDGTLRQKAYTAAYPMATVDGVATSRAGVFSDICSLNTAMTTARTLGTNYTVTTTAERYTECLYMWVEFATRNLQSIMRGASDMSYAATDTATVAEDNANRIIVTNAVAAKYIIGQTILIGTSLGSSNVANNRIVTAIEIYDADNKAIVFDGAVVNIAVGNIVCTAAWVNGSCNSVLSSSGSPVSNSDGKHNCIYRGKETPYGNAYEQISDVLFNRVGAGTTEDPYTYDVYFLPNPTQYAAGAITDDYVKLNYTVPGVDGHGKKLGFDSRFPWLRIPSEIGASTTTYYSDYYYYPRSAVCAARVGGGWSSWSADGPCCWYCSLTPSFVYVYCRARLSYYHP